MLSHGLLEKESNVRAVVLWEVGHHTSAENGLWRHRVGAGRPHMSLTSLSIFLFSNGNNKMYFYVCYEDEVKL